jgi:16S rRNA (guanine1207-N2)-methyltransferase
VTGLADPSLPVRLLAGRAPSGSAGPIVFMHGAGGIPGALEVSGVSASPVWVTDRHLGAVTVAATALSGRVHAAGHALHGHGAIPLPAGLAPEVVAIRLPADRLSALQLIADAFGLLPIGGTCLLAGATDEGIKPAARTLARAFGHADVLSVKAAHRVVAAVKRQAAPADPEVFAHPLLAHGAYHEVPATFRGHPLTLHTRPGVFSWEHVDDATALLADVMQVPEGASVLDLGCGSGALGLVARLACGAGPVTLVDADSEALRSARRTAEAAGVRDVRVLASDVGGAVQGERFDVVLTNPPFHRGKHTDVALGRRFIREGWELLRPGGRLFLVANRTLPYEAVVSEWFGARRTVHDGPRFKVLMAERQG